MNAKAIAIIAGVVVLNMAISAVLFLTLGLWAQYAFLPFAFLIGLYAGGKAYRMSRR